MIIIIDLDLQQAVQGFGSRQPAPAIQVKSQDTPTMAIYFTKANVNYDLGTSPGVRFGLYGTGPNALVQQTTFTRTLDAQSRVAYIGYPNFNTTQMLAAIGAQQSIQCVGEIRYQTSFGTIARTADIAFSVQRSLLSETVLDTTIAAFTTPAVNANVTVRINSTGWLSTGLNLTIGAGAGAYQVVSITNATDFIAKNMGGAGNAAPATVIPSGTNVGIAATNVIQTYPDASLLELITRKNAANGYAGLNATSKLATSAIPVDGTTINFSSAGNLQLTSVVATVAANFVTPASGGTINVTVSSSSAFVVGQWVRIPIAGYYSVTAVPDGTHVTFQNLGDLWNAASGTTITTGAAIVSWTSLGGAGGGGAGQNAYSTTSSNFTVPAVSATVPVTMASTAWLGAAGYVVFITGAGYYAVSSITNATQAVLINLGYLATNAAPGTVISSGSMVTPGGVAGPSSTGTPGANAYDATTAGFTVPAILVSVPVAIGNTAWLTVGQVVVIAGAGSYQVAAITSATVFTATNLNYSGNATAGAVIGSGAHVSPGGLIGPAGAGGAGLNAFTTLSASFTQPAALAGVTINVGTTAWMVVGQAVFILGGGYYTVSSVTDINHAVVTNLGYSGNATSGATIASGGGVVPSGLNGQAGTNAFTTTAASFTIPAIASPVTVTVGSSAWMAQGQNLYVAGAGYFSVSVVTDATHVVLTNSGAPGNVVSGTVIASGAQVSPAGSTGLQGATGAAGPQGPAGSGGGGGGSAADIFQGLYFQDDFISILNIVAGQGWQTNLGAGGTAIVKTTYGQDATRKFLGSIELACSVGSSGNNGSGLCIGQSNNQPATSGEFLPGIGAMTFKYRLAVNGATPPVTGNSYVLRAGLMGFAGSYTLNATLIQRAFFEYSPDNNSGQWRVGVGTTSTTYTNTTTGLSVDTAYDLQIDVNAANTQYTFTINGTVVATITTGLPSGAMYSVVQHTRDLAISNNYRLELDAVSGLVQVVR